MTKTDNDYETWIKNRDALNLAAWRADQKIENHHKRCGCSPLNCCAIAEKLYVRAHNAESKYGRFISRSS